MQNYIFLATYQNFWRLFGDLKRKKEKKNKKGEKILVVINN